MSLSENPIQISFVIPAYNEEALIGKCLASIERELADSPYVAEIIVVNNASTDRTRVVAESFANVRVVDELVKGLPRARQAGFLASRGKLVANVDADAMLTPGWINVVIEEFAKQPVLVGLSGPCIYYDLPPFSRFIYHTLYSFGFFLYLLNHHVFGMCTPLQGGNFVLRRSALEQVGGYDTSILFFGEDVDIAKRMDKTGLVKWTPRLSMYASGRRISAQGISVTLWNYAVSYMSVTFIGKSFQDTYTAIRNSHHST